MTTSKKLTNGNITIHDVEQGSAEWFECREDLLTGSIIGAILGHSKWKNREGAMRDLVRAHFGLDSEFEGNVATEFGKKHEPMAVQDFEIRNDCEATTVGFVTNDQWDMFGVSPDSFIGDDDGLEVKCPYSKKTQTLEQKPDYYDQICISLLVTERERWHYFSWVDGMDPVHEVVTYADAVKWWELNRERLEQFYTEFLKIVQSDKLSKPYLEDKEIDLTGDETYKELCLKLDEVQAELSKYKKLESEIKAKLVDIAKEKKAKIVGYNHMVFRSVRKGSVNYGKIAELKGVDLEPYRKESTVTYTVK
jgi:predicted phage-related endonuclease